MADELDDRSRADRRAIEAIIGRSFEDDEWPTDAMPSGTRVRVVQDDDWAGPWAEVFLGTVDATVPPQVVRNPKARPGELEYSVAFDHPQLDASGDGPYRKAVIWARYLENI